MRLFLGMAPAERERTEQTTAPPKRAEQDDRTSPSIVSYAPREPSPSPSALAYLFGPLRSAACRCGASRASSSTGSASAPPSGGDLRFLRKRRDRCVLWDELRQACSSCF